MNFQKRIFNKNVIFLAKVLLLSIFIFLFCSINLYAATVTRISSSALGVEGNGQSLQPNLSEDNRYIVFISAASNLVDNDTNGASDVFVYDRIAGVIERVNLDNLGNQTNGNMNYPPDISSDGRYVAFESSSGNLVSGDSNVEEDIFVYDRDSNTVERVSVSSLGVEADGHSIVPSISDDGRYVAFLSNATNLVAGDTNSKYDIFVHDRNSDVTERVSVDSGGGESNDNSEYPYISADGQFVVFASTATDLVAGDTNGFQDIFVHDRNSDVTERVSVDSGGGESNGSSTSATMSTDGQFVVFTSYATDLVAGDTNGFQDIFVHDRNSDVTERVSLNDSGTQANSDSYLPRISSDGQHVSFYSLADNLTSGDSNSDSDVFLYDRDSNTIDILSLSSLGVQGNAGSSYPSIYASGGFLVFRSSADNLVSGDTNGVSDIFLYSLNNTPTDVSLSPSSISENQNFGTNIGNFTVTDADVGDTHTFSLACTTPGADDSSFSIVGDSLRSAESFDYETKSSFAVCVRATDSEGATYDENITITINDLDESSGGGGGGGGPTNNPPPPPPPPPPTPDPDPILPPPPDPEPVPEDEIPDETDEPDAPNPPADNPSDSDSPNSPVSDSNSTDKPLEFENFPEVVAYVLGDFIDEIPKGTIDTISVVGVTLPALAFIITQPAVAVNLATLPMRLWNLLPIWLGFRRKKRPWGTVYDSVTKQPLDPVYVSLKALNGKEVATTITDLDGRFGFLVAPGRYKIMLRKDNYVFPSKKLAGKGSDELYGAVYEGEEIEIAGEESLVIKNIPMDSESFNWNEFEKAKNKKLMKFYSKRDVLIATVANVAFWGGLACSLVLLFTSPSKLNYILLGVYLIVLLLRFFGVKPKKPGYVTEKGTGYPMSFGVVKIFSVAQKVEIGHAIIGKTGKYYVLVPNGEYYVKIEKKIGEDEYKEVYLSDPFRVKKGFIGQNFNI